jgi:hypothetical protein
MQAWSVGKGGDVSGCQGVVEIGSGWVGNGKDVTMKRSKLYLGDYY